MKKFLIITLLVSSFMLGACTGATNSPSTNSSDGDSSQKQGDTTMSGTIKAAAGKYYLEAMGQTPMEIDSYTFNLADYVGREVTVTGQYSGDTLFVGEIK